MLYDKRWEKPEIKADPFSLESLIAWLEKQPADGVYQYMSCLGCALAQYFTAHGFREVNVGPYDFAHKDATKRQEFPEIFDTVIHGGEMSSTFGAALTRAREALAARR